MDKICRKCRFWDMFGPTLGFCTRIWRGWTPTRRRDMERLTSPEGTCNLFEAKDW